LQDLREAPEHLWSARKRRKRRAEELNGSLRSKLKENFHTIFELNY